MRIRQQDKELINHLSLLGAGIAAILAVLAVFNLRDNAKNQLSKQRHYIQQIAPILALSNSQLTENLSGADNITGDFLENVKQADVELTRMENGFWPTLPLGHLMILCAVVFAGGLISGYCSVWLISAIGTYATIKLIRLAYKTMWRKRPDFDGGRQQIQNGNDVLIRREKHRLLSGVLKMCVVALIGLIILWVVVYYITGLP
jgi:beta-lactamase regulating signal transducer with metallopeptidase domain